MEPILSNVVVSYFLASDYQNPVFLSCIFVIYAKHPTWSRIPRFGIGNLNPKMRKLTQTSGRLKWSSITDGGHSRLAAIISSFPHGPISKKQLKTCCSTFLDLDFRIQLWESGSRSDFLRTSQKCRMVAPRGTKMGKTTRDNLSLESFFKSLLWFDYWIKVFVKRSVKNETDNRTAASWTPKSSVVILRWQSLPTGFISRQCPAQFWKRRRTRSLFLFTIVPPGACSSFIYAHLYCWVKEIEQYTE